MALYSYGRHSDLHYAYTLLTSLNTKLERERVRIRWIRIWGVSACQRMHNNLEKHSRTPHSNLCGPSSNGCQCYSLAHSDDSSFTLSYYRLRGISVVWDRHKCGCTATVCSVSGICRLLHFFEARSGGVYSANKSMSFNSSLPQGKTQTHRQSSSCHTTRFT